MAGFPFAVDRVVVGSVVPPLDEEVRRVCEKWLAQAPFFLRTGDQVGLRVTYDPPNAVGADRLANAVAALELCPPPIVVVDFGTATTFDCIDSQGRYAGGAIMPGVQLASDALSSRAAKLPKFELRAPARAVGRNTVESMQSGTMFGYAGAVEAVVARIAAEVGKPRVLATGGLGGLFVELCPSIEQYEPRLTLEGLRIAASRI
jgi:type III pantothenate kinase